MTGFIMAAQLILGLSILVFIHELGHFLFARMFKTRVEQFYLFFNPKISLLRAKKVNGKWQIRLFSRNVPARFRKVKDENGNIMKDEKNNDLFEPIPTEELPDNDWRKYPESTEWGIGWLPFGGYCSIAGMIDENKRANQLSSKPQSWELRSKPAWQRLLVMLGGVIMNLILGFILFVFITYHYKHYTPNEDVSQNGIYVYDVGKQLGFETGDKIVAVNGKKVVRFEDATQIGVFFGSKITVERNGQECHISLPDTTYRILQRSGNIFSNNNFPVFVDSIMPNSIAERGGLLQSDHIISINDVATNSFGAMQNELKNNVGKEISVGVIRHQDTLYLALQLDTIPRIGISVDIPYQYQRYSFEQAVQYGIGDAFNMLTVNIKGFGKLLKGKEKATDSLQGPIGIASMYGGVWDWARFWFITAILSLVLAFMNVLPIPALDGGHIVFILIEMVTGRKPSDKILEQAQIVGMIILFTLMFFVIGNDIFKLFK
ncbi:MAG: RIP metalloprotease RseP [Bacteroidales bacterium]|nr:RIP metalloprotease RseP [Bacteroidales bacterium]